MDETVKKVPIDKVPTAKRAPAAKRKHVATVTPIGEVQQQQVIEQTELYIRRGEKLLSRCFDRIPVHFDLKGRSAGMYKAIGRGRKAQRQIRYNPWIFAKYYEENLNVTVPHEVAHYLVDCIYGLSKVRPHGVEWKELMDSFGVSNQVTTTFDLEGIPIRRQQQFDYRCGCKDHKLGIRRHNKILRGEADYRCRYCSEILAYIETGHL